MVCGTQLKINKGTGFLGKVKGISVYNFEDLKGRNKGVQYWILLLCYIDIV